MCKQYALPQGVKREGHGAHGAQIPNYATMLQLTGQALVVALQRTEKPIKRLDTSGAFVVSLEPDAIAAYLERGYEVHGTARRVRYIKPAAPITPQRPDMPWQACWLTQEAAVIRFHGEAGA